jgi:hypothetical protein
MLSWHLLMEISVSHSIFTLTLSILIQLDEKFIMSTKYFLCFAAVVALCDCIGIETLTKNYQGERIPLSTPHFN